MADSFDSFDPSAVRFDADGLVPVVVQAAADRRVLMLAYADTAAIQATLVTGEVHFHSRSRRRLWRKGESSGNVLRLVTLSLDCDGDALLAVVEPAGPTCHRGTRSCFDRPGADRPGAPASRDAEGFAWLEQLWATIESRREAQPEASYTASLLSAGVDAAGRKVVEEATEVLIAAKDVAVRSAMHATGAAAAEARKGLAGEAADLMYHLLVLLAERGLRPSEVIDILRARAG